jgi:hypothetical protein
MSFGPDMARGAALRDGLTILIWLALAVAIGFGLCKLVG